MYALNNPLKFIDPSGYYNKPSPHEREQAKEGYSYYNPYFNLTNPQLAGNYRTNYNPGSGFAGSIAAGTHFDWKTGKNRTVFMDVTTGRNYYKQQTGSATWWSGGEIHVKPLFGPNVYLEDSDVTPFYSRRNTDDANWAKENQEIVHGVGAFTLGNAVKGLLINSPWVGELSLAVRSYSSFSTSLGVVGSTFLTASAVSSIIYDVSNGNQINGWDIADASVGGAGLVATLFLATNPVGWGIIGATAVYSGARLVVEINRRD